MTLLNNLCELTLLQERYQDYLFRIKYIVLKLVSRFKAVLPLTLKYYGTYLFPNNIFINSRLYGSFWQTKICINLYNVKITNDFSVG